MTQPRLPKIDNPNPQIHGVGHPHIDRRMLAMARLAAEKIDRNPELLQIAIANLQRWARTRRNGLSAGKAEWKALIARHSWPELRAILVQAAQLEPLYRDHQRGRMASDRTSPSAAIGDRLPCGVTNSSTSSGPLPT